MNGIHAVLAQIDNGFYYRGATLHFREDGIAVTFLWKELVSVPYRKILGVYYEPRFLCPNWLVLRCTKHRIRLAPGPVSRRIILQRLRQGGCVIRGC